MRLLPYMQMIHRHLAHADVFYLTVYANVFNSQLCLILAPNVGTSQCTPFHMRDVLNCTPRGKTDKLEEPVNRELNINRS